MDTLVMIRHPAAFVGSLKVKNWKHPFYHFLVQSTLMEEHLHPFEKEIKYFAQKDRDIVDQAALLWKLIHYMILKFRKTNPHWIFIRHEDLSQDPINGFKSLYSKIKLEFSENISEIIKKHSCFEDSTVSQSKYYFNRIHRDSVLNIYQWKKRLTTSEVERVKSQVNEISKEFYSKEEW
jgi:hypothetical protein